MTNRFVDICAKPGLCDADESFLSKTSMAGTLTDFDDFADFNEEDCAAPPSDSDADSSGKCP